MNHNQPIDKPQSDSGVESPETENRRELVSRLGKLAIYAAPFTVMALNSKGATSSGPRKH